MRITRDMWKQWQDNIQKDDVTSLCTYAYRHLAVGDEEETRLMDSYTWDGKDYINEYPEEIRDKVEFHLRRMCIWGGWEGDNKELRNTWLLADPKAMDALKNNPTLEQLIAEQEGHVSDTRLKIAVESQNQYDLMDVLKPYVANRELLELSYSLWELTLWDDYEQAMENWHDCPDPGVDVEIVWDK